RGAPSHDGEDVRRTGQREDRPDTARRPVRRSGQVPEPGQRRQEPGPDRQCVTRLAIRLTRREMSISAAETLEWLFHPRPADGAIDRKALAGLLVDLARAVEPRTEQPDGVAPFDPRLEELRRLILGHEIDLLKRLREVIDDPEQLGVAVGRALPTAVASSDARLGHVLAPALERATETSIRNDPRILVDILQPVIGPAIRKSV